MVFETERDCTKIIVSFPACVCERESERERECEYTARLFHFAFEF